MTNTSAPNLRSVEPTRMSEATILLIVAAAILFVAGVIAAVALLKWPDAVAHDRLDVLKLIGLVAGLALALALLIQLSSWVGAKLQFHAGADGVSANIDNPDAGPGGR